MTLDESRLLPGMGYRSDDGADRPVTNLEMYEYVHLKRKAKTMTKVGEMFGGSYLKATDLKGKLVTVTISDLYQDMLRDDSGGEVSKWIMAFEGKDRKMVLNKTNANLIACQHGDEAEEWIGKQIKLYAAQVEFGGKMVPAIRVYHELSKAEEAEEDIPF